MSEELIDPKQFNTAQEKRDAYERGLKDGAPKWISAKTPPEVAGDYWVYRVPRKYTEGFMQGQWAYSHAPMTTRHWDGKCWLSSQEVTHYMPLPAPPKEKE